ALRRADRVGQKLQLVREDLFECAIGGEQAVTHEDGLLPVANHVALRGPVVVVLCTATALRHQGRSRQRDQRHQHHSPHVHPHFATSATLTKPSPIAPITLMKPPAAAPITTSSSVFLSVATA